MARRSRRDLADTFAWLNGLAEKQCRKAAREIVAEIRAGTETPVVTGYLRKSYYVEDIPGGAEVRSRARYWMFVEFGTETHEEQPHLRPAIEAVRARHT